MMANCKSQKKKGKNDVFASVVQYPGCQAKQKDFEILLN